MLFFRPKALVSLLIATATATLINNHDLTYTASVEVNQDNGGAVEVTLQLDDQVISLQLATTAAPIASNFKVEYRNEAAIMASHSLEDLVFYAGSVTGHPDSSVHLVARHQQLRGTLHVDKQLYHLEPSESAHKLYHNSLVRRSLDPRKGCGLDPARVISQKTFADAAITAAAGTDSHRDRRGFQGDPNKRVCDMIIVADHLFFATPGNSSREDTTFLLMSLVNNAARIFASTNFSGGIGTDIILQASKIIIYETENAAGNVFPTSITNTTQLLYRVYSLDEEPACLRHLVTNRVFPGDSLGLASVGGLCTHFEPAVPLEDVNVTSTASALSTWDVTSPFPLQQTQNVFAHELGHVFGSEHDDLCAAFCTDNPGECSDATTVAFLPAEGHFLMNAAVDDGPDPNNDIFSACSIRSITAEINDATPGGSCLAAPVNVCGNGIVEEGEACDCGSVSNCTDIDPCCTTSCQLVGECSPANGPCCNANCTLRGFETIAEVAAVNTSIINGLECNGTAPDECFRPLYCIKDAALGGACPSFNYPCGIDASDDELSSCQSQGFFFLKSAGTSCNDGFNTCNNRGCQEPLNPSADICEIAFTLVAGDAVATFSLSPTEKSVQVPVLPGSATIAAQVEDCSGNVVLVTPPVDVVVLPDRQSVLLLASNDDLATLAAEDGLTVEDLLLSLVIEPTTVDYNESITFSSAPGTTELLITSSTPGFVRNGSSGMFTSTTSTLSPTVDIANNVTQLTLATATINLATSTTSGSNTAPQIVGTAQGLSTSTATAGVFAPVTLSLAVRDPDLARSGSGEFIRVTTDLLSSTQYPGPFSRTLTASERTALCGSSMGVFDTTTVDEMANVSITYTPNTAVFGFQSVVCVWSLTVVDKDGAVDESALAVAIHSPSLPPITELRLPSIRSVHAGPTPALARSTQRVWVVFQDLDTSNTPSASLDLNGTVFPATSVTAYGSVTFGAVFDVVMPNVTAVLPAVVTVTDADDAGQATANLTFTVTQRQARRDVILPKVYLELSITKGQYQVAASQASFEPTTTIAPTGPPKADNSLTTMAVVGIVVGCICLVLAVIMLVFFIRLRNNSQTSERTNEFLMT
eukprot:m.130737 g.130737  ORF g.130737 m.130737 type:complete len:1098 (+) comp15886_c0_seq1:197-3490(+)